MAITEISLGGWHRRTKIVLILLSSSIVLGSLPTTTARNLMKSPYKDTSTHRTKPDFSVCASSTCKTIAERMIKSLNEKLDPCDDFYEFACGGRIGPESNVSNLQAAVDEARITIKNILESNASSSSSAVTKVRRYYHSCLEGRDKKEDIPKILVQTIKDIGGWHIVPDTMVKKQKFNLQKLLLETNNKCHDNPLLFHWDKYLEDFKVIVRKEGIYNDNDTTIIEKLIKICGMMGCNESEARAQFSDVLQLRKELSEISLQSDAEEEDYYDPFTLQDWQNSAPFLNWTEYFNGVFSSSNFTMLYNESIDVDDPEYFYRLGDVITKYNKTEEGRKIFTNFVMWHLTLTLFDYLNDTYTNQDLRSPTACLLETIEKFRAPVIALFVRQEFTDKTKSQVEIMSKNIRRAYRDFFKKAVWMDAATKQAALERFDSIHESIGFPDYILNAETLDGDFKELIVDPVRYYHNKMALYEFEYLKKVRWSYAYLIDKIYKEDSSIIIPSLPSLGRGPYYIGQFDLFLIPASVMQPPIYYDDNTMSYNYGALGSIIGHELTHAIWPFTSYDWIPEEDDTTLSYMNYKNDCIKDQYTNYTISGRHLNGTKTLEENIADNSGVKASFYAYLDYSKKANVNYTLPGVNFNHRQLFFISFAQMWCQSYTEESLKKTLQTDVHSITKFRVIGPLSNSKEFSEEFNCPVGSKMNPVHKCTIF